MSAAAFSAFVAVVVGVVLLYRARPEAVKRSYNTFDRVRKVVMVAIIALAAWTFLRSGQPELVILALVLGAIATAYLVVERPDKTLV